MITFVKKVVASQKKFYLGLLTILSFLASFEYISVVIYSGATNLNNFIDQFMLQSVTGIVIMIAFVLILFVNNYLVEHKTDEFSLILLMGKNTKQVLRYIIIQFGLLFLLCSICNTSFILKLFLSSSYSTFYSIWTSI